jgi:hypothetical protein
MINNKPINPNRSKIRILFCSSFILALWLSMAGMVRAATTNFVMTTPDYIYAVNGESGTGTPGFFVNNCPPLTLAAGQTYTFTMQAGAFHPMVVGTNASNGATAPSDYEYVNAAPQEIASGTITLTIPATGYPTNLYYQCNFHGFYGVITVAPPPAIAPPQNEIVSISVTTNIVLISTGTSTSFVLVPQFSSNLVGGAWAPVPSFTNSFANGTNVTTFDRLDPICGPNVFLRISQEPPN